MEHILSTDGYYGYHETSECGLYRYMLTRSWDASKVTLPFILMHPTTAGPEVDEPTIRRCIAYAKHARYGGIAVASLIPLKIDHSKDLAGIEYRGWAENDAVLKRTIAVAKETGTPIVCAWGGAIKYVGKHVGAIFLAAAKAARVRTVCIETPTSTGAPRHPLQTRSNAQLVPYP